MLNESSQSGVSAKHCVASVTAVTAVQAALLLTVPRHMHLIHSLCSAVKHLLLSLLPRPQWVTDVQHYDSTPCMVVIVVEGQAHLPTLQNRHSHLYLVILVPWANTLAHT